MQSQTFSDKKNQEAIHFRCPQCQKLYSAHLEAFQSHEPHFECLHCHSVFGIDLSQFQAPVLAKTSVFETKENTLTETKNEILVKSESVDRNSVSKKACPKCGATNNLKAEECKSCQVVFAKIEGQELSGEWKVSPTTMKLWKSLLEDFENQNLHQEFIESCSKENILAFALERYETLDRSFGGDPLVRRNLEQVRARILAPLELPITQGSEVKTSSKAEGQQAVDENDEIPLKTILMFLSYGIGILLFFLGVMKAGPKNSSGFGVALIMMTYGVIYFIDNRKKLL